MSDESQILSRISKNLQWNWYCSIRDCVFRKKHKSAISTYVRSRGSGTGLISAIPLVLKACTSLSLRSFGKMLHSEIVKSGVEFDVVIGTSLVDMYGKCGDPLGARKVFDDMPVKNVITWNAMIGGYMRSGGIQLAMILFGQMVEKTPVTWIELIDGYARIGDMAMARRLFNEVPEELKTVVTWTVMVDGFVRNGEVEAARELFERMEETNFFVWSVMITGYFKNGEAAKAKEIFDRMRVRNLVNWNALISSYAQNGMPEEALGSFVRMQEEGFKPDEITLASVLSACAQSGRLDVGKKVHGMILEKRIELNVFVLNGLVDMYAKCGDLANARMIFDGMLVKNTSAWNSLITGFGVHGQCREAIAYFSQMVESDAKPDSVTFLSVLSACAHGGFVEQGLEVLAKMEKYGLAADIRHYGCLVDLLGRAGKLQEAYNLVRSMPVAPNDTIYGALLGACRIHSDTAMAEKVVELVRNVSYDAHYVLLSSIYAASERWEMAEGMRAVCLTRGSEKTRGHSAVMV